MRILSIILATVLLIQLSSCDTNSEDPPPADTVIGLAIPLTGSLARVGQDMRLAAEMATALTNEDSTLDATIRLSIEDTRSTADGTKEAFEKLIADGTQYIVGPYSSANTEEIIPIIDEAGVVTIAPASAADGLSEESQWLFRSSLTVDYLIPAAVKETHDALGYDYIASLTNQADRFSVSAFDKLVEEIGEIGRIRLDLKETFARFPDQAIPQMDSQIRSLLNPPQPLDAIFFFGLAPDRLNFILRSHLLGLKNVPIIMPALSTSDIRIARETVPDATEGIYVAQVWVDGSSHPTSKAFVEAFQKRYSALPNDFHARAYAAINLLFKALEETEVASPTSDAVRVELSEMRNVDTIYGPFSFDENGDAIYSPQVGVVRGNTIELLND